MLEIKDLITAYGPVKALDGVDVSVPAGKITAVLGANGAGKTTLLRTVSGLVRSRSGQRDARGQGHHPGAGRGRWCGSAWRTSPRAAASSPS